MKNLNEIATGYMDLFISSKGKNLDFFMMYNNIKKLSNSIENVNKVELNQEQGLEI